MTTSDSRNEANQVESLSARAEVELDIPSDLPNPTWVLTAADANSLVRRIAALSRISAKQAVTNPRYGGLVVQLSKGPSDVMLRIRSGIVVISKGAIKSYASDEDRSLERWLLETGRAHVKHDLLEIAERE